MNKLIYVLCCILILSGLRIAVYAETGIDPDAKTDVIKDVNAETSTNTNINPDTVTTVVVKGVQEKKESTTKLKVDKSTIDKQGGAEQINLWKAISTMPGVNVEANDAFGMEVTHRVRGRTKTNNGETVEGLPIKGIGPGSGLSILMDLENVDSISVFKGGIRADSGLGFGSDNGMIDLKIKQPSEGFHAIAKQVFGTEDFNRSYARVDTGNLGDIAKIYASGSFTDADKWKGEGKSPDGRKNFTFGLSGTADQPIEWKLDGLYNEYSRHWYKGLTYEESKHLSKNYNNDYNSSVTGTPATDINYYDNNREQFRTYAFFGKIATPLPLLSESSLTLKPYFLNDKGHRYNGNSSINGVVDWIFDHDTYGGTLEFKQKISKGEIKAGYWYGEQEAPGPPTAWKKRSTDGNMTFQSWAKLIKATNHKFNSPYITADKTLGPVTINTGVRYLWMTSPDLTSYNTTGIGDVSYSEALDQASTEKYHLNGKTYEVFLPNAGVTYEAFDKLNFRLNYGRNYDTPEYGIVNQMDSLLSTLGQAGLQKAYSDKIKPEETDDFDFGVSADFGTCFIESTLFYSRIHNVRGSFYDPVYDKTYSQNAGEAHSYGLEILTGCTILKNLDATLSLTYNKNEYTKDIQDKGYVIKSKGHQIPDSPEFAGNLSMNWEIIKNLTLSPTARYIGKRYADVENEESVDPYFVVDLALGWKIMRSEDQNMTLKVSATNLFNEKYISYISASDTEINPTNNTYNVGAPRTIFLALQVEI